MFSVCFSVDQSVDFSFDSKFRVFIFPNGRIQWFPSFKWRSTCAPNLVRFPYDKQVCTLTFISWAFPGKHKYCLYNNMFCYLTGLKCYIFIEISILHIIVLYYNALVHFYYILFLPLITIKPFMIFFYYQHLS